MWLRPQPTRWGAAGWMGGSTISSGSVSAPLLLFSLVEDAATVGSEAVGNSASNTTRVPSDAASTILQQNSQIKPVLRKNQGEDVGITVAQDFDFSTVYGLASQIMAAPGKNTAVLDSVTAPLRKYLDDARVTELVINRPGEVGIERRG